MSPPPAKKPTPAKKPSAKQAQRDAARRRNIVLASVLAVAVVAVAAVLLLAGGGDDEENGGTAATGQVAGVSETNELFDGIPQRRDVLGEEDAPVTMIEFADLQCPFCKEFALGPYPVIVNDYVRKGKLRVETRTLAFIGPDSEKGARASAAAAEQDKLAEFQHLWFFNQGQENSGYATDEFIESLWKAAGVDVAQAKEYAASAKSSAQIDEDAAEAEKYGVVSTPSFVLGETGGTLEKVDVDISSPDGLTAIIDELAK